MGLVDSLKGLPGGSVGKEPACNAGAPGDMGSIPGSGRSPGEGHSNSLQYSCLEDPMDRGAWLATFHRVAESDTTEATEHSTELLEAGLPQIFKLKNGEVQ